MGPLAPGRHVLCRPCHVQALTTLDLQVGYKELRPDRSDCSFSWNSGNPVPARSLNRAAASLPVPFNKLTLTQMRHRHSFQIYHMMFFWFSLILRVRTFYRQRRLPVSSPGSLDYLPSLDLLPVLPKCDTHTAMCCTPSLLQ